MKKNSMELGLPTHRLSRFYNVELQMTRLHHLPALRLPSSQEPLQMNTLVLLDQKEQIHLSAVERTLQQK